MTLKAEWIDGEREPQCEPDPAYPSGKDVVAVTNEEAPVCRTSLPYPAKRCGVYLVECSQCGLRVAVTTAGRVDDPKSVTVNCKAH